MRAVSLIWVNLSTSTEVPAHTGPTHKETMQTCSEVNNIMLLWRRFDCYYNDDKGSLLLNKAFLKPSTFVSVLEGTDKLSCPVKAASNQEMPVSIWREWMHCACLNLYILSCNLLHEVAQKDFLFIFNFFFFFFGCLHSIVFIVFHSLTHSRFCTIWCAFRPITRGMTHSSGWFMSALKGNIADSGKQDKKWQSSWISY